MKTTVKETAYLHYICYNVTLNLKSALLFDLSVEAVMPRCKHKLEHFLRKLQYCVVLAFGWISQKAMVGTELCLKLQSSVHIRL